jgi:ABC-type oligopeptide transport system substrate-binding subunit
LAGLPLKESNDSRLPPARLRFTCLVPEGFIIYEHLALEVQKQLSEVGVDIKFDVQKFSTYNIRARDGEFEAVMVDLASGPGLSRSSIFWRSPDRSEVLKSFGYRNPETETLFESLHAATSDSQARPIIRALQTAFAQNPPAIFLAWNERARAVRGDFQIAVEQGTDPLPRLWQWGRKPAERPVAP